MSCILICVVGFFRHRCVLVVCISGILIHIVLQCHVKSSIELWLFKFYSENIPVASSGATLAASKNSTISINFGLRHAWTMLVCVLGDFLLIYTIGWCASLWFMQCIVAFCWIHWPNASYPIHLSKTDTPTYDILYLQTHSLLGSDISPFFVAYFMLFLSFPPWN